MGAKQGLWKEVTDELGPEKYKVSLGRDLGRGFQAEGPPRAVALRRTQRLGGRERRCSLRGVA